jgi:hypothetical protein
VHIYHPEHVWASLFTKLSLGDHRFQAKETEDFQKLPFYFLGKDLNTKIAEMTRRRVSREESQGSVNVWKGPSCRQDPPLRRVQTAPLVLSLTERGSPATCAFSKSQQFKNPAVSERGKPEVLISFKSTVGVLCRLVHVHADAFSDRQQSDLHLTAQGSQKGKDGTTISESERTAELSQKVKKRHNCLRIPKARKDVSGLCHFVEWDKDR